jgi:asparagine synthase (glutamine-hydrolysing)
MCGITGFWSDARPAAELEARARAMSDRLTYRGPDDAGIWCDAETGLALAHRRLSIIDLSPEGHQPMRSADGRWLLSYNGEIYNYPEVAAELAARGVRFRSSSDTEVLLEGIAAWGVEETLGRIAGMFAFAVWDAHRRRLFLARDRLGIKPLYYGSWNGSLLFGSELKALRAYPGFAPELDREAIALYLRHGYIPGPRTVYRGVRKLQPGHLLVCDAPAPLPEPRCWWNAKDVSIRAKADSFRGSPEEAVDELEQLGRRIVGEHMVADVPLGAFLSGGIDSSTVVALMQSQSARPVRTFTIGFQEDAFDEARYAREVARHLGTDHTDLYLRSKDAEAVIPALPEMWDEPFADPSQIPTFLVSRLARGSVTVSLSGDGGDELFGGYTRYQGTLDTWARLPGGPGRARRFLAGALRAVPAGLADGLGAAAGRARASASLRYRADLLAEETIDSLYRTLVSQWRHPEQAVLGAREPRTLIGDAQLAREIPDPLERMMLVDTLTYLPDDILTKVDRASMAVSLEARVPLLDHRLVEFAWRLPLAVRVRGGRAKWPLCELLARHVPRPLFERPKQGFGVPIGDWLRGPLREWGDAMLSEERLRREGIFDAAMVRATWDDHVSGVSNEYKLWVILMFQAWLDHASAA